jgi:transaldolase / glucose-6-phosphate isomerase
VNLEPEGAAARCRPVVTRWESERAVERIWSGDASFWKTEAVARHRIESSLGWLTLPDRIERTLADLERFGAAAGRGVDRVLVLGMGGASLAPAVFARSFAPAEGFPTLEVLDSTEPSAVAAAAARSDPGRTLFVISSKSGTTFETNILFDFFFEQVRAELADKAGERFVVVTDPGSPLEKEAAERGVRAVFPGDPLVGGRYSALSNFGLVPAALSGVDLRALVGRARRMAEACRASASVNPGVLLGAALATEAGAGRDKLTFSIDAPHERLGRWLEQLVAESTGKEGQGIVPIDGEPLGPPQLYGSDRFFVRYETRGRQDPAAAARARALVDHGHTVASFVLQDSLDLGAEMFRWELAAAVASRILGVNPFDEPDLADARSRASAILAGSAPAGPDAPPLSEADLPGLLKSIRPGDYFVISAYLHEAPETDAALQTIAMKVRRALRVATSVQFAPRLLHSTGQLHKGGPNTGVFLQITSEARSALPVPGRPWGFARALEAQAAGDFAALTARGRRVARVRLSADVGRGLDALSAAIDPALPAGAFPGRSVA